MDVFDRDSTHRWPCRSGDSVLWLRCIGFPGCSFAVGGLLADAGRRHLLITNRLSDVPDWLELQPDEVRGMAVYEMMGEAQSGLCASGDKIDAPMIWRPCAGDRLMWAGPGDVVLDLRTDVLAVVESDRPDLDPLDMLNSDRLDQHEVKMRFRMGFEAACKLGVPRAYSPDWRLG